jgi:hypothetical protein
MNEYMLTIPLADYQLLKQESDILRQIRYTIHPIEIKTSETYKTLNCYEGGIKYITSSDKQKDDVLIKIKELVNA